MRYKWTSFAPPGWTNFAPPLTPSIAHVANADRQQQAACQSGTILARFPAWIGSNMGNPSSGMCPATVLGKRSVPFWKSRISRENVSRPILIWAIRYKWKGQVISADQARRRAAQIINRIKAGEEPVPESLPAKLADGPTVAELAVRYLDEHVLVRCKPSTARTHRQLVGKHLLPEFGKLPAAAVGREHVTALHYKLRHTPATAHMVIAALSQMIKRGEDWGLIPEGGNLCRFVVKYRQRKRERFLTEEEFRRLGRVLGTLEAAGRVPVHAAAAIRLLMLTGCRRNEILTLRWEDVHLEVNELRLRDSKTGPRAVPLSPAAVKVIAGLPRAAGNPWVIAGRRPGARLSDFNSHWYRVRTRAGLEDVRLHDLRHSFASAPWRLARACQ